MPDGFTPRTPVASHHPGPPRFVHVGEPIRDPVFVLDADTTGLDVDAEVDLGGRDGLAPRLPELRRAPDDHAPDAFEWSVAASPAESDGDVLSFATSTTAVPRHDAGLDHVAEFEADAPGRYRLALDAPDGTHDLTVHAFPEPVAGPPPRVDLDATLDAAAGRFRVDSNAALAPRSDADAADLRVVFLADDRDPLSTAAVDPAGDGLSATLPVDALGGEPCRVHAVAYDGCRAGAADSIELRPDGTVGLPNRPPAWLHDAVIYQVFTRSWAGRRGATTFETLIEGDPETGARGVDYLEDLGVDVVWLTPVVPARSVRVERAGGGPHGYDTLDYFGVAEDLAPEGTDPLEAYRAFVDACHERGIRVCFDLVVSHAGLGIEEFVSTVAASTGDPLAADGDPYRVRRWDRDARTFDWWDRVAVPRYAADGTVLDAPPRPTGFADLRSMPNWNYDSVALREYVLGVVDFWSRSVGVDGFRCDIAFGVQHGFWREVRELVRANDAEFLLLDEAVPNDPAFSESQFDAHVDTVGFTRTAQDLVRGLSDRRTTPVGTEVTDGADGTAGTDGTEGTPAGADGGTGPPPEDRRREPDPDPDPAALVEAVLDRRNRGHPDYSLLLNSIENHDEHRLLGVAAVDPRDPDRGALTDGEWDRAAGLGRACFAAAVTLPGVPTVYYGAERGIGRYGEGRVDSEGVRRGLDSEDDRRGLDSEDDRRGLDSEDDRRGLDSEDDRRGLDSEGEVDPFADVRPGGRQRAFMNWDRYDEGQLAFYRRMIDLYHDLDALHADADADLEPLDLDTDVAATCFVRDAVGLAEVSGPEAVLVCLNFEADPVAVDLPDGVEPTNFAESAADPGPPVTVDTVGVFPLDRPLEGTPTLRVVGE